jgi:Zn-dependent protease with chaperone function
VAWRCWPIVVAGALLCGGCAVPISRLPDLPPDALAAERRVQQTAEMRAYYQQLARVDAVAFRLRVANRQFCKNIGAQAGMLVATVRSLPRRYRSYASEALNLSWTKPTVISVVEGSPAAYAGIKAGDQVLFLDQDPVPASATAGFVAGYVRWRGERPIRVALRRDGVERAVEMKPILACAIPIDYVPADDVNAFTTDDRIVIKSAIVRAARTDAQLAAVIGHELAHSNLGHLDKQRINKMLGMVGGAVIDAGFAAGGVYTDGAFARRLGHVGETAYSVEFEREADYVGAYYAARAGYDLAGVEEFWREMGITHPDAIHFARTHPTTPARFVQLREVAAEIEDKKRRHLPLLPDLKVATDASTPGDSSY